MVTNADDTSYVAKWVDVRDVAHPDSPTYAYALPAWGSRSPNVSIPPVKVEKDGKEFVIEADSVVCALGFRAPYAAVDALCDEVDESYVIGDCRNVGQIHHAINQGYYTALLV